MITTLSKPPSWSRAHAPLFMYVWFCILAHPLVAYDLKWLYGGYWGYQGLLLLCSNMVVYVVCTTVQIGLHKASE